jgi:hypothetical protein
VVKNVEIIIRDQNCKMKELVIMDNEYDIILGVNYFEAMSGMIFKNGRKILKFFSEDNNDNKVTEALSDNIIEELSDDLDVNYVDNVDPNSIIDTEHLDEDDFDQDYWEFPEQDHNGQITEQFFREKSVKPDSILEPSKLKIFDNVIASLARHLIPKSEKDLTACTVGDPYKIVVDPNASPIYIKPYRYSIKEVELMKTEMKTEISTLL